VAAGIGYRKQGARTRPGQIVDRNIFLLEDAQDPEVGDAAREASTERDPNARPALCNRGGRRRGVGEFANAVNRAMEPV
jgi:hypothetical protein